MTGPDGDESARRRLEDAVTAEGGLLAGALDPRAETREPGRPAQVAAGGPRSAAAREEYELVVDLIHEGYLVHYRGRGGLVAPADPDLGLLLGDQLYALGLTRLAALGDLEAVTELADVISLCAHAHATDDAPLAGAVWEAGAVAVGWGSSPELREAKAMARAGEPAAAERLHAAATELAQRH